MPEQLRSLATSPNSIFSQAKFPPMHPGTSRAEAAEDSPKGTLIGTKEDARYTVVRARQGTIYLTISTSKNVCSFTYIPNRQSGSISVGEVIHSTSTNLR